MPMQNTSAKTLPLRNDYIIVYRERNFYAALTLSECEFYIVSVSRAVYFVIGLRVATLGNYSPIFDKYFNKFDFYNVFRQVRTNSNNTLFAMSPNKNII